MSQAKYDLDHLEESEVKRLLHALKHPQNEISFRTMYNEITTAMIPGFTKDQLIIDPGDEIEYIFHIKTSRFEERYSIHLRFKKNKMHLVRLDIGSGHQNPDGKKIVSDHIHFYASSKSYAKNWGIPIELSDFPNVKNFVEALDEFLQYTNIL